MQANCTRFILLCQLLTITQLNSQDKCFGFNHLPILAINDKLLTKPVPDVIAGSKLTA
jgi:hypothetical protein